MAILVTGNAQHQSAGDDTYLTIFRYTDNRAPNGSTLTRVTCFFHSADGSTGLVKRFTENSDGTFDVRDIESFTVPAVASLPYEQPFEVVCNDLVPSTGDHYYGVYLDDPAEAPLDLVASTTENYCLASEATGNSVDFGVAVTGDYQIECRFELPLEMEPISNCLGRVGETIDRVLLLINDYLNQDFTKATQVLTWMNKCRLMLAQDELFVKTTTVTWPAGPPEYVDLLTEIPDIQRVRYNGIRLASTSKRLKMHTSWDGFAEAKRLSVSNICVIEDNKLWIYPVPTAGTQYYVNHSYTPAAFGCTSNYTPNIPVAHDLVYDAYCMSQACLMDATDKAAMAQYPVFSEDFKQQRLALKAQNTSANFAFRPSR